MPAGTQAENRLDRGLRVGSRIGGGFLNFPKSVSRFGWKRRGFLRFVDPGRIAFDDRIVESALGKSGVLLQDVLKPGFVGCSVLLSLSPRAGLHQSIEGFQDRLQIGVHPGKLA